MALFITYEETTVEPPAELESYIAQMINTEVVKLDARITALEQQNLDLLTENQQEKLLNQQQADQLVRLQTAKTVAEDKASNQDRLLKVMLLSFAIGMMTINPSINSDENGRIKFSIQTKEVPLWVGAGYGAGILMILLEKEQWTALLGLVTAFTGRGKTDA